MTVLALDTSTESLSVCLLRGDSYCEVNKKTGLKHAESLMPLIASLFEEMAIPRTDVDLIACGRGPGSFTGLRIGIAAAKGLSAGLDRPLKLVPTLDAMAFGKEWFSGTVMPVIDARKQRFYTACYSKGQRQTDYLDISLQDLLRRADGRGSVLFTGPAAPVVLQEAAQQSDPNNRLLDPLSIHITALPVAMLGEQLFQREGADRDEAGPLYMRKSEAENARGAKKDP